MEAELAQYVEDVALFWEQQGLPRIAGRIMGLLLVCDPPWRSASQLADELGASKGSISTMTRLLLASGSIETRALPGDRATYFQLASQGIEHKLERRFASMVAFRALADRGLDLLVDAPEARRERLERVAHLYRFLERELPALLDRWRAEVQDA